MTHDFSTLGGLGVGVLFCAGVCLVLVERLARFHELNKWSENRLDTVPRLTATSLDLTGNI